MKLPKSALIKDTTSLFAGKYNYKIVLVSSIASWFRHRNYIFTESEIKNYLAGSTSAKPNRLDLTSSTKLLETLKSFNLDEYMLRIESPYVNIYTNQTTYVEKLAAIDASIIKFICLPNKSSPPLVKDAVIVKNLDFAYKVHVGATKRSHDSFIVWSENNPKIRLTKRCITDLSKSKSWGGSYFYVKDEKTLTMAKIFLGSDITKIESVVKS